MPDSANQHGHSYTASGNTGPSAVRSSPSSSIPGTALITELYRQARSVLIQHFPSPFCGLNGDEHHLINLLVF